MEEAGPVAVEEPAPKAEGHSELGGRYSSSSFGGAWEVEGGGWICRRRVDGRPGGQVSTEASSSRIDEKGRLEDLQDACTVFWVANGGVS